MPGIPFTQVLPGIPSFTWGGSGGKDSPDVDVPACAFPPETLPADGRLELGFALRCSLHGGRPLGLPTDCGRLSGVFADLEGVRGTCVFPPEKLLGSDDGRFLDRTGELDCNVGGLEFVSPSTGVFCLDFIFCVPALRLTDRRLLGLPTGRGTRAEEGPGLEFVRRC